PDLVSFHDGMADGQSKAQAIPLRTAERFKQPDQPFRADARSTIADFDAYRVGLQLPGADDNRALVLRNILHRVESVQQEIQYHLLQLDAVTVRPAQRRIQFERDMNLSNQHVAVKQPDDIRNNAIEVQWFQMGLVLLDERAHLADHLSRAFGV